VSTSGKSTPPPRKPTSPPTVRLQPPAGESPGDPRRDPAATVLLPPVAGVSSGERLRDPAATVLLFSAGAAHAADAEAGEPTRVSRSPDPPPEIWLPEGCDLVESLGDGGTATVHLCRDRTRRGREVVVKVYKPGHLPDEGTLRKLKGLRHEDIVALLDYGFSNGRHFEVMEYAAGGSLKDRAELRPFSERELVEQVIPEVLNGLRTCHARGIVHRDVKEANLFYRDRDRRDIVIGDFGSASWLDPGDERRLTKRVTFTPSHCAPEVYEGNAAGANVNRAQDYFSLGITLIYLTGTQPFPGTEDSFNSYVKSRNAVPLPERFSERFASLLRGLLHPQPDRRWGEDQVEAWLRGEAVPVEPLSPQAGLRAPYAIDGKTAQSIKELARLLYDHPREAAIDIGRKRVSAAVDDFDPDKGRAVSQIEDLDVPLERRYVEIVHGLDPELPYRLTPDRAATTPEQLARLIDADLEAWTAGGAQLASGLIASWLTAIGQQARVEVWRELGASLGAGGPRPDATLEAFLKVLDPRLPAPELAVSPASVKVRCSSDCPRATAVVEVSNPGRGHLHGTVRLESSAAGIATAAQAVDANRHRGTTTRIEISIDASSWTRGAWKRGRLLLDTNARTTSGRGDGRRVVEIQACAVFPRRAVLGQALAGAAIGAAVAAAARGLIAVRSAPLWIGMRLGHYPSLEEAKLEPLCYQFEYAALPLALLVAVIVGAIVALRGKRRG